jgi:nucleotide-binding universal stress UspA family protein
MITTVAAATDGSATATEAVRLAAELARRFEAKLVLLSAFQDKVEADRIADTSESHWASSPLARIREMLARTEEEVRRTGIDCSSLIDDGHPADVVIRLATECGADVLVIGSKGMDRRVLGSVPNSITHKSPCSVLVVKTT